MASMDLADETSIRYADLQCRADGLDALGLLDLVISDVFAGRVTSVASFGTKSAVLLAMIAEVSPATPVTFLDTGKHFAETLSYRDAVAGQLGLTDLRVMHPDPAQLARYDGDSQLWRDDPDGCCQLRKVEPLGRALNGFDAWISGRKRYQGWAQIGIPKLEWVDGKVKVNPLADWSAAQVTAEFERRNLPRHPLETYGYLSIGCAPCTQPVLGDSGLARSGRWAGHSKTECGIHDRGLVQAIRRP